MRKIIVNSTPIIAFNKIGKLDLLKKVYGKLLIPYAVYEEVISGLKDSKENDFKRKWLHRNNSNQE